MQWRVSQSQNDFHIAEDATCLGCLRWIACVTERGIDCLEMPPRPPNSPPCSSALIVSSLWRALCALACRATSLAAFLGHFFQQAVWTECSLSITFEATWFSLSVVASNSESLFSRIRNVLCLAYGSGAAGQNHIWKLNPSIHPQQRMPCNPSSETGSWWKWNIKWTNHSFLTHPPLVLLLERRPLNVEQS